MTKKIFIVLYSMYGHVFKLANEVKKGIEKVPGFEVKIFKVAETLPEEVLQKMHATTFDLPVLDPRGDEILQADGLLFGIPSRFGLMPAQMKNFFDGLGGHWGKGSLNGKPAGVFFSTAQQHGGLESIALTTVVAFSHLGMVFVPVGYSHPLLFDTTEVIGASQYGAGTIAGDGSRQPSEKELTLASHHGEYFAGFVNRLK